MATGNGLLETWHQVVLLVPLRNSSSILWIMLELDLAAMPKLQQREGKGNLLAWLMSIERHCDQMVLLDSTEGSTFLLLASLCIAVCISECMIL